MAKSERGPSLAEPSAAQDTGYIPFNTSDWGSEPFPSNVQAALDYLAANAGGGGNAYTTITAASGSCSAASSADTLQATGSEGVTSTAINGSPDVLTYKLNINGLAADGSPDGAADYVATYDADAGTHKKVLLDNLPGGSGDVTAAANLTDNTLIRGDGGAKGIQDSGITISDTDAMVIPNSAAPLTIGDNTSAADVVLTFDANDGSGTLTFDGTNDRFTLSGDLMVDSGGDGKIYLADTDNSIAKTAATLWNFLSNSASDVTYNFSNSGAGNAIVSAKQLKSTIAIGTKPLDITSTTLCDNLNAEYLDGNLESAFALLAGRSGGQTLYGDTASSGDLTLGATAHATKGLIYFGSTSDVVFDETNKSFGIGCDDPTFITSNDRLTVVKETGNASITAISHRTAAGGSGSFSMGKSRGEDHDNPTTVADGDTIGIFNFKPYDGTSWLNHGRIQCVVNGTVATNQVPLDIQFKTGSSGVGTIVATITSSLDFEIASGSSLTFGGGTDLSNLSLLWNSYGMYSVATGNEHRFQVNSLDELYIEANQMTFKTGGSEPLINWASTTMKLQSASNVRISVGTTGLGFFGNQIAQPAAYTLGGAAGSRTLNSTATAQNNHDVLRQVIEDLQAYGLLQ